MRKIGPCSLFFLCVLGVRITIDREAHDYLSHLYGPVNWPLVDDVARVPLKVADIYRRLTT